MWFEERYEVYRYKGFFEIIILEFSDSKVGVFGGIF